MRAELKMLKEKEKMLQMFLDSNIAKDKSIEVSKFVNQRVDSGGRTYRFKIDEWVDHSDTPETL